MILQILASGSRGNVTYVEEDGQAILVDVGLSCRETVRRLKMAGRDPQALKGIFITHDHKDHIAGARVMSRTFGLPIIISDTLYSTVKNTVLKDVPEILLYSLGNDIPLKSMNIHPVPVNHDATETVNVVISNGKYTLGIFTDLGTVSLPVKTYAATTNLLVVEANHDLVMLKNGPYPLQVQQRIRSNYGHLSNDQCGKMVVDSCERGHVKEIILAHVSENNNTYHLAYTAVSHYLTKANIDIPLYVATQNQIMPEFYVK